MPVAQLIRRLQMITVFFIALAMLQGTPPLALGADATFIVTKTQDTNDGSCDSDCSLREAVIAANGSPGASTILLAATTYTLSIEGSGEDAAATGDLDILGDLIIQGTGTTVIEGISLDRIFHVHSGSVTISGVTLKNGNAHAGGAIYSASESTLTLEDSHLLDNDASSGGALYVQGGLTVRRTTFEGNRAVANDGGAIFLGDAASAIIVNSTLTGNSAQGYGGGLVMSAGGSPQAMITNSTIVSNTAGVGGGVSNNWNGTLTLRNTIVAHNSQNCSGSIANGGNNLQYPGTTCAGFASADPLLRPLGNNGASTPTYGLEPASPAIDQGNNAACPSTDQRGVARPQDGDGTGAAVCDIGAVERQSVPFVLRAATEGSNIRVQGRLHSSADTSLTLNFYASTLCDPLGTGVISLGETTVATDAQGNASYSVSIAVNEANPTSISATATDSDGNTSDFSSCRVVDPGNDGWTRAQNLDTNPGFQGDPLAPSATVTGQSINQPSQSRWYKFSVQPGSRVVIHLSNLPANYDVALFRDIQVAFQEMNAPKEQDLERLGAEFAPEYFTPEYFTPEYFTPEYFTPEYFTPEYFTPEYFTPEYFTPEYFTPEYFTPEYFTPEYFTPEYFTPEAYSNVQQRSLLAVSAGEGGADEFLDVNTWNSRGNWYIRVYSRDGAYSVDTPFHLEVTQLIGECGTISSTVPGGDSTSRITPGAGAYETVILTDLTRMVGSAEEKQALQNKLQVLAGRSEVRGVVLDMSTDSRLAYFNSQADANPRCPYAKNLVAAAIREIVRDVRDLNDSLAYVVLIGNDDVIPFFRHPDNALLANESGYMPPVQEGSASNASLRMGYVLGQDAYGAQLEVAFKSTLLPIPDLAVGRLVETPTEIMTVLDAYLGTSAGVAPTPQRGLVTGYEFMVDAAEIFGRELAAGIGSAPTTLLTSEIKPTWTADELRTALLGSRHDLVFLAGHFSTAGALAADYETRMAAAEVARSSVDLTNSIIVGMGCHAGYNTVDNHAIPQVTQQPDWAQAFARKGATLISGTGYQYGDTDFIAHSELLYVEFSKQFRYGNGPVPVGKALVEAKKAFLSHHPDLRGISEKSYLIATLFGLPMLSVDMPHGRTPAPTKAPLVSASVLLPATTNPGAALGLQSADVSVQMSTAVHTKNIFDTYFNQGVTATYIEGMDGVVSNPAEPVLPVQWENASVAGTVLRGILFLGGTYSDLVDVRPLTGSPTTEGSAIQAPFFTDFFYPVLPWRVNYLDALAGGVTRFVLTPAQFRSNPGQQEIGTLRRFHNMQFRLYYSSNTTTYGANTPALSAPPVLSDVSSEWVNGSLTVRVRAQGNPAAGIQGVFVTFSAVGGPWMGQWHSLPLQQQAEDSTLWQGTLPLNGTPPEAIRYFLQAVNGVGLVGVNTNRGAHYTPGTEVAVEPMPGDSAEATQIVLPPGNPTTVAYNSGQIFRATLQKASDGSGIAGQTLHFRLGTLQLQATTDINGVAEINPRLLLAPGDYSLQVAFAGNAAYRSAGAVQSVQVTKQATLLQLSTTEATGQSYGPTTLIARLSAAGGQELGERTVFFVLTNGDGQIFNLPVITNLVGEAQLWAFVPAGVYTVRVFFSGEIPFPAGTVTIADPFYLPSTSTGTLTVIARDATVNYTGATVAPAGTDLLLSAQVTQGSNSAIADLTQAQVEFKILQDDQPARLPNGAQIMPQVVPVSTEGTAVAVIAGLGVGVYEVQSTVVGGYFRSSTARSFVAIYDPTGGFVTGGGWIHSPAGACQLDALCQGAVGRAHFAFVAKYQKGAHVPTGNTKFQLLAGALDFESDSYEWLVVAEKQAKFKGVGRINDVGHYGFMLTAVDGDAKKNIPDGLRIKIWDRNDNDRIVYDNQMGAGDDSYAVTNLGGGSIVIHEQTKGKTIADDLDLTPQLYLPVITNR